MQNDFIDHLFNECKPLEGIFTDIIKSFGKNAIIISTSGNSNSDVRNILNEKFTGAWISSPHQNSWIKFDLKTARINIVGYTLRVYQASRNIAAPHSWCVEGSNDNFKWILIDEHRKDYSLQQGQPQHFTCQMQLPKIIPIKSKDSLQDTTTKSKIDINSIVNNNPFRYIRIRQTDTNVLGGNSLCLSNAEFFGNLLTL